MPHGVFSMLICHWHRVKWKISVENGRFCIASSHFGKESLDRLIIYLWESNWLQSFIKKEAIKGKKSLKNAF